MWLSFPEGPEALVGSGMGDCMVQVLKWDDASDDSLTVSRACLQVTVNQNILTTRKFIDFRIFTGYQHDNLNDFGILTLVPVKPIQILTSCEFDRKF